MPKQISCKEHEEIERPDSQYPAKIKRLQMNGVRRFLFSKQQLGNEIGAKQEKQADPEGAGVAKSEEHLRGKFRPCVIGQAVVEKNH